MLGQHVAHAQQADLAEQASLCALAEAAARAREAEAEVEVALEAVAECDEQAETELYLLTPTILYLPRLYLLTPTLLTC